MAGMFAFALAFALVARTTPSAVDTESPTPAPPPQWVCDDGCWNTEDDECFLHDPDYMGCMQIYGHREWRESACNCRWGQESDRNSGREEAKVNIYFSIPAFVVLFRESLEVVLVLVIILQFLQKSKDNGSISDEQHASFRREVYVGAGFGFIACIAFGVGILCLVSLALREVEGETHLLLEGTLMLITSVVLSVMALNFYKMLFAREAHERKMANHMRQALESAAASEQGRHTRFAKKHTFFVFAFMTGLREGLESILFLSAIVVDARDLSSLPIPIVSAIILARVVGWCFFRSTQGMPVAIFMKFCALLLLFIAAGFFSSSMHNFQELDVFGTWSPKSERPWQNRRVFDARECCNDMTNRFFVFMRAMFGWQDQPTPLEFLAYALYWIIAIIVGAVMLNRAKKHLEQMRESWRRADEQRARTDSEKFDGSIPGKALLPRFRF